MYTCTVADDLCPQPSISNGYQWTTATGYKWTTASGYQWTTATGYQWTSDLTHIESCVINHTHIFGVYAGVIFLRFEKHSGAIAVTEEV